LIDAIVEERSAHGPYASLMDLCRRVEASRMTAACSRRWCAPAASTVSA